MNLHQIRERYPGAHVHSFGDTEELSASLLDLVRSGKKTSTCFDVNDVERGIEEMPVIGNYNIALNFDRSPALVTRTTDVELVRFCDVGEDFALAEGENDSLEGWRKDHQKYFERTSTFDVQMMLVCERFELIEYF